MHGVYYIFVQQLAGACMRGIDRYVEMCVSIRLNLYSARMEYLHTLRPHPGLCSCRVHTTAPQQRTTVMYTVPACCVNIRRTVGTAAAGANVPITHAAGPAPTRTLLPSTFGYSALSSIFILYKHNRDGIRVCEYIPIYIWRRRYVPYPVLIHSRVPFPPSSLSLCPPPNYYILNHLRQNMGL